MQSESFTTSTEGVLNADVLLVGYGPVGAAMATFLGNLGVKTLVIDKSADILAMPRAIALDNEALRILQQAGLKEDAFEKHVIHEVRMLSPYAGQFGRAITLGCQDGHPRLVTFYQPDLENALRKQSVKSGLVEFMPGFELLTFQQDTSGVTAIIRCSNEMALTVNARYLVGADGAASTVRQLIGQEFEGETFAEDWLIVDACQRQVDDFRHVEFWCNPRLPAPHMPAPGGRERWEFMIPESVSREEALSEAFIHASLKKWVGDTLPIIERKAVYRFHARCAKSFQNGRAFLIGDAAHITPPFVGQGLVAGLRDASNLSWKLARAIRLGPCPQLLESYDAERRPHARKMIGMARMMGRLVMPNTSLKAVLLHNAMAAVRWLPPFRRYVENLQVKPGNCFKQGFFKRQWHLGRSVFLTGGIMPQGLVRLASGEVVWSDDAFVGQFHLLALGVKPHLLLTSTDWSRLLALGVRVVTVLPRGSITRNPDEVEDLQNTFFQSGKIQSMFALIRPDCFVFSQCDTTQLPAMLNSVYEQLEPESLENCVSILRPIL